MTDSVASAPVVTETGFPSDCLLLGALIHPPHDVPAPPWDRFRWLDDEGRPLEESRARPDAYADAGMELKTCPYRDSRFHHEKPMNVSALQQSRRHFDIERAALAELRDLVRGEPSPEPLTTSELWRVICFALMLPGYLRLSRRHPHYTVPGWTAAVMKTCLGLALPLTQLVVVSRLGDQSDPPAEAEAVRALADEEGTLIGKHQVCAASPRMILDLLEFVIQPPAGQAWKPVQALLGDMAPYRDASLAFLDGCTAAYLFYLARKCVGARLRRVLAGTEASALAEPMLDRLDRVETGLYPELDIPDDFSPEDERDLLSAAAGLLVDPEAVNIARELGAEFLRPPDADADEVAQLAKTVVPAPGMDEAVTAGVLAQYLLACRLERVFLDMLGSVEARLRAGHDLGPYTGPLDRTVVDAAYPDNPRRAVEEFLSIRGGNR